MSRRLIAILLPLLLVLGITQPVASASIKKGSPCSKVGKIQVSGKAKFKCTKSGNKLLWQSVQNQSTQVNLAESEGKECLFVGDKILGATQYLECRSIAGNRSKWFLLSKNKETLQQSFESDKLAECRLRDQSPPYSGLSVGFPLRENVPVAGKVKVALIPIDFADTVGDYSAINAAKPHMEKVDAWLKQFTNNRMSYDWQVTPEWIRNPKKISDYGVANSTHFGYFDDRPLVQDLLNVADPVVDFTNIKIVLFLFPRTITALPIQVIGQNQKRFSTNEGTIGNYWGGGRFAYQRDYEKLLWAIWIHETMHMHGLPGHAPGNGWPLSVTTNQYGVALAINTWESFLAGWLDEKSILCRKSSDIKDITVTLTPIDRNQDGLKSVMIPLNDHEILVIESRRGEAFSSEMYPGFYGLTTYLVDTRKNNDRSQESSGKDQGNDTAYPKFVYYLKSSSGDHGSAGLVRGILDRDILAYEGEHFLYNGIKISLIKSGDFDTVQIQKVS
jgi:hypothetical protein